MYYRLDDSLWTVANPTHHGSNTVKEVHVFDVDGTIVDSTHRYRVQDTTIAHQKRKINLSHWLANQSKANKDTLLPLAKLYQEFLRDPSIYVIIATARELHSPDWQFFTQVLGLPDKVISRKYGDNISGVDLKPRPLRRLRNLKQFRNAVWHMWEDNAEYLTKVCDKVGMVPHFIPSAQGY